MATVEISRGLVAEFIASIVLGESVEWKGGNTKGYDLIDSEGRKVQVKAVSHLPAKTIKGRSVPERLQSKTGYPIRPGDADYWLLVASSGPKGFPAELTSEIGSTHARLTVTCEVAKIDVYKVEQENLKHFRPRSAKTLDLERRTSLNQWIDVKHCTKLDWPNGV